MFCVVSFLTATDLPLFLGEYPEAVPEFYQIICRCIPLPAKLPQPGSGEA